LYVGVLSVLEANRWAEIFVFIVGLDFQGDFPLFLSSFSSKPSVECADNMFAENGRSDRQRSTPS
jgi:hypothetical protein